MERKSPITITHRSEMDGLGCRVIAVLLLTPFLQKSVLTFWCISGGAQRGY